MPASQFRRSLSRPRARSPYIGGGGSDKGDLHRGARVEDITAAPPRCLLPRSQLQGLGRCAGARRSRAEPAMPRHRRGAPTDAHDRPGHIPGDPSLAASLVRISAGSNGRDGQRLKWRGGLLGSQAVYLRPAGTATSPQWLSRHQQRGTRLGFKIATRPKSSGSSECVAATTTA